MSGKYLFEVLLYEDLLSDGVDVGEVSSLVPARVLRSVKRHRFVYRNVTRTVHTALLEENPTLRIYGNRHYFKVLV